MATELVDVIAQTIRVTDGSHTMGAGELAEHIAALFEPIGWVDDFGNLCQNGALPTDRHIFVLTSREEGLHDR